jgi:hypothetical protein
MMWVFAGLTALVLAVIAVGIKDLSKLPTVARPAALSASVRPTQQAKPSVALRRTSLASPESKPSASTSGKTSSRVRKITDADSGLSYRQLSSPWRRGCLATLNTPMFSWSAGERAVAEIASGIDWYGDACSGLLRQQFQYAGPADLQPVAMGVADAVDLAYYSAVQHYRTVEDSFAIHVSGHPAWEVTFVMTYPDAAGQGLAFSSETGAVVIVDRGVGQVPAVFYASVPSNLGASAVRSLVHSLRLAT